MSAKRWTIELDGGTHAVLPEHGHFSARRRLIVDGRDVDSGREMEPLPTRDDGSREGQWFAGVGGAWGMLGRGIAITIALR